MSSNNSTPKVDSTASSNDNPNVEILSIIDNKPVTDPFLNLSESEANYISLSPDNLSNFVLNKIENFSLIPYYIEKTANLFGFTVLNPSRKKYLGPASFYTSGYLELHKEHDLEDDFYTLKSLLVFFSPGFTRFRPNKDEYILPNKIVGNYAYMTPCFENFAKWMKTFFPYIRINSLDFQYRDQEVCAYYNVRIADVPSFRNFSINGMTIVDYEYKLLKIKNDLLKIQDCNFYDESRNLNDRFENDIIMPNLISDIDYMTRQSESDFLKLKIDSLNRVIAKFARDQRNIIELLDNKRLALEKGRDGFITANCSPEFRRAIPLRDNLESTMEEFMKQINAALDI